MTRHDEVIASAMIDAMQECASWDEFDRLCAELEAAEWEDYYSAELALFENELGR